MLFTVTQYLESVLNSRGLTRTLGEIDVCRTADGRPVFHTGNSAVIFRIRLDGRDRLLKCYTRPHRHLEAIYGDRFRPAELFLYTAPSEGMWADVVVDDWIEGETLTRTLDRAAANGDKLLVARLATAFDTLAARLLPAQWAHGDLKPDNLIWDGQRLRPIDFDGMFLPEFRGRRSPELGTHAFQHPARTEADFDASLDDYPAALIATVLHAAAHDPSLLVRYPAEGLVLDPSAVIEGRSEAYREMLDAFARRGDAVDTARHSCSARPSRNFRRPLRSSHGGCGRPVPPTIRPNWPSTPDAGVSARADGSSSRPCGTTDSISAKDWRRWRSPDGGTSSTRRAASSSTARPAMP